MNYSEVALRELVKPRRRVEEVRTDRRYRIAGIYSFGKGMLDRGFREGSEISYKTLFRLGAGDVVFARLNAWEGALAIVSDDFDGAYVSNEYPTFEVNTEVVECGYIRYLLGWASLWARLTPRGSMVRRKRTTESIFLDVRVPLPGLDEQRRIVRKLNETLAVLERLEWDRTAGTSAAVAYMEERLVSSLVEEGWDEADLDSIAEINPKKLKSTPLDRVLFVPMAAVDDKTGRIVASEWRMAASLKAGYTQFCSGDVIFARINPCMQNGKSAIVPGERLVGYGSTEFHVIRTRGDVSPAWLHFWVRRSEFRRAAALAFSGTAGQQRVSADFLKGCRVLLPPNKDAEQSALRKADRLAGQKQRLEIAVKRSDDLRDALRPALLNAAFSGRL